jgi:hypothetical protein
MKPITKELCEKAAEHRMKQLRREVLNISLKMDDICRLMCGVGDDVSSLDEEHDLYDFSTDTLNDWLDDWNILAGKVELMLQEYDRFAFDGDSIRIEENDEN